MKTIRVPVNLDTNENVIRVNLEQEFDTLEILSLKITSSDTYKRTCADFGVIVGRCQLNSGYGVQNAKVSIFVPITQDDKDRPEILQLYPFESVNDTYPNGVRYNLLPRVRNNNPSHRAVGNFPDISDFSQYPTTLEVFDKYYKYTTTTNDSGDYMIFGAPLGTHDVMMDFDIFDTKSMDVTANDLVDLTTLNKSIDDLKILFNTQATENSSNIDIHKVPNFIYNGNNNFDIEVKTNISDMPNIFNIVKNINISPFWGDDNFCDVGITRCDFKIPFNYTPTAIFFGYLNSLSPGFAIDKNYNWTPSRQPEVHGYDALSDTTYGDIYPYQAPEIVVYRLDDNLSIGSRKRLGVFKPTPGTGVFRLSLPMYMDYYTTNEYGDLIKSNDPKIGTPTTAYYAFEIYETNEVWGNIRNPSGGFQNSILPGIRIPSSLDGDRNLGGWEGTWTDSSKFEYDIINKKRKFYTIKSVYSTHDSQNVKLSGNYVSYFPQTNPFKVNPTMGWNFPIEYDDVPQIVNDLGEVSLIGSVLTPRAFFDDNNNNYEGPSDILSLPWISYETSFNQWVNLYELILGIGVQKDPVGGDGSKNGTNGGTVYDSLFSPDQFINGNGDNIFGDLDTWNFGDNSKGSFKPSLFAIELAKSSESNANGFSVHKPYTQTIRPDATSGAFISSININNSTDMIQVYIYDITDELPNLMKDRIYSSFNSTYALTTTSSANSITTQPNPGINIDPTLNFTRQNDYKSNLYNNNFYYFGMWNGSNALMDIQNHYFNIT